MATKPTAQRVLWHLCVVAPATSLWMAFSHLQLRIWWMMSGRNRMRKLTHGVQIEVASWRRKQMSKSTNRNSKRGWLGSCDILKWSETTILVSLLITSKVLLLITIWLGYTSTITLSILPLQALWPIVSVQAATQLQISRWEDGMHWLDSASRICVVGWYFAGTLEGVRISDNLEFFRELFGSLFGVLFVLSLHNSYSCMKDCVESSLCWDWSMGHLFLEKT